MSVNLGSGGVNSIKLGTAAINKIYLGTVLLFGGTGGGGGGGGGGTFYTWTRNASAYDDNGNGTAQLTISFNTDGTVSFSSSSFDVGSLFSDFPSYHWHDAGTVAGIGNSRWAKKTAGGDPTTGTLTTSLVSLSTVKTLSITTVAGDPRLSNDKIEIYSDAGGTTKVGEINLSLGVSL